MLPFLGPVRGLENVKAKRIFSSFSFTAKETEKYFPRILGLCSYVLDT